MEKWTRALYQPNLPLTPDGRVTGSAAHIALSRQAAEEGAVLLKNEGGLLPLDAEKPLALFGKGCFDYVKGGGGSGDVTVAYVRDLYEGLKAEGAAVYEPLADFYRDYVAGQYAQGAAPGLVAESALPEALAEGARAFTDTALIVLSRFSGEGWDRSSIEYNGEFNPWEHEHSMPQMAGRIFPRGDFYLTDAERTMIETVCARFDRVAAVLNTGGVIDLTWVKDDRRVGAALLIYQGGMEGGAAAARLLLGKVSPSGKLPDTFARDLDDYPSTAGFHDSVDHVDYTEDIYVGYRYFETLPGAAEKVCYSFGHGLSYTAFTRAVERAEEKDGTVRVSVRVENTGAAAGREVVQLYCGAPQGKLQKPARVLAAFAKTGFLLPGESQTVQLCFTLDSLASFDDLGKVQRSAWVLEKGRYRFYLGGSVREAAEIDFAWDQDRDRVTQQMESRLAPTQLQERLLADGTMEPLPQGEPNDPNACAFEKLIPGTDEAIAPAVRAAERHLLMKPLKEGVKPLSAVAEGEMTLDAFMAQMTDAELIHLLGGQPNTGVANTYGIGNMPEYGVPNIATADGPAGLRLDPRCGVCTTAFPCATLLAASWDPALVERVGAAAAEEVKENNLSVWLAPAVNLHRNPLCGRNFEYYSEDPLLIGAIGAAMVRGVQSRNVAATVKHFACNNKETNRKHSDSRLSERALREMYLKGFEIIVRQAQPWAVMSSYNIVNGHRASECRPLLVDILRGEWGFQGLVMTDWWTRAEHYKEILAGNDLKMACGYPERVEKAMEMGLLTREDLEYCARHVLELILKID